MSRKWMNIGSASLFVAFLIFVATYKTVDYKRKVSNAETMATEIAHGVAMGDSEVIVAWASGGTYIDPWGNAFVLITNDHSGVMVASRGRDGEWGTSDDIQSHICDVTYPDRIFIKPPKKKISERVK